LDVSEAVDRELARELRGEDNGGRETREDQMEFSDEEVLAPYLREEEGGRREGESWKEMLRRQRREKKTRRQERNREEVARIRRGEVTAAEVFEERMKRRVVGEEKREAVLEKKREAVVEKKIERRIRKKEAWVQRRKEAKAAAILSKREAAKVGGPMRGAKSRDKGSEVEVADGTLLG
jgi:hypothetical protein